MINKKKRLILTLLFALLSLAATASADLDDMLKKGKVAAVIGEEAHSDDIIAALHLMRTLYSHLGKREVILYDSVGFSSSADVLEYNEPLGEVRRGFTKEDLNRFLASGSITTEEGRTLYNQYLFFNDSNASVEGKVSSSVIYGEEDLERKVGSFLFWNSNLPVFSYVLEFENGLRSEIKGKELAQLEDKKISILGEEFTIAETSFNVSGDSLELVLMSGITSFFLRENETANYTIGPREYEVSVLGISETANKGEGSVKLVVDGEITRRLNDGDTDALKDGTVIGITSILPTGKNVRKGAVTGYLGTKKLRLLDRNFTDEIFQGSGIEADGNVISTGSVRIRGSKQDDGSVVLHNIHYLFSALNDIYVPQGEGLFSQLSEPSAMLTDSWDIIYPGTTLLRVAGQKVISPTYAGLIWDPVADHSYRLNFTTQDGYEYFFEHLTNEKGAFIFGKDGKPLHFKESTNTTYPIALRNRFVISDASINNNDDTGNSHILEYSEIDTINNKVTFTELGKRPGRDIETKIASFGADGSGTLIVGGNRHSFFVNTTTRNISIDLDKDGAVQEGDEAVIATKGNALIDLGDYNSSGVGYSPVPNQSVTVRVVTLAKRFKNPAINENITFAIENRTSNKIGISEFPNMTGGTGYFSQRIKDQNNTERASTGFGVNIEFYDSGSDNAEKLTLNYPFSAARAFKTAQTGHQVIISGQVLVDKNATEIVASAISTDMLLTNITQPLILIGGPCANNITAQVLMVSKENCLKGFEKDKPMVKFAEYKGQPVLILAGLTKEDTREAVREIIRELVLGKVKE